MPRDGREIRVSDQQIALIVESLDMLETYQLGAPKKPEQTMRMREIKRLRIRMERKLIVRGSGATGNYAEKL